MSPEEHTKAIHALQTHVTEIKALINNSLRTMVKTRRASWRWSRSTHSTCAKR